MQHICKDNVYPIHILYHDITHFYPPTVAVVILQHERCASSIYIFFRIGDSFGLCFPARWLSALGAEAKQELMQKLMSAAETGNLGAATWLQQVAGNYPGETAKLSEQCEGVYCPGGTTAKYAIDVRML